MNVILTYFCNGDTATDERKRNAGNHALRHRLPRLFLALKQRTPTAIG